MSVNIRVPSLALLSGLRICCRCKLQHRLETRLGSAVAVAVAAAALLRLLAWGCSRATGAAVKRKKMFESMGSGISITLGGRMEAEIERVTKVQTMCYFLMQVVIVHMSSPHDSSLSRTFMICELISVSSISVLKV